MRVVRVLLWVLCAAYWVALFTLTHLPRVPKAISSSLGDKAAHFLAYSVLAGVLYLAIWASKSRRGRPAALVIAITFAYGALDELTQPFVGRSCDFVDWLADAAGVLVIVGLFVGLRHLIGSIGRRRRDAEARVVVQKGV
jgi:VanZ family protein